MAIIGKRRKPKDDLERGMHAAQKRFAKKRAFYRKQVAKGIAIPFSRRKKYLPDDDDPRNLLP